MTIRKARAVAKNFKTEQEWSDLGFEVKTNEFSFAYMVGKGTVFADCQVKKKKNNDRQKLQDGNR